MKSNAAGGGVKKSIATASNSNSSSSRVRAGAGVCSRRDDGDEDYDKSNSITLHSRTATTATTARESSSQHHHHHHHKQHNHQSNATMTMSAAEKTSSASLSSLSAATTTAHTHIGDSHGNAATTNNGVTNQSTNTPSLNKCLPISSRISRYQQHCQQQAPHRSSSTIDINNSIQQPVVVANQFNSISIIEVFLEILFRTEI